MCIRDSLKILRFPERSDEWLDFIAKCRAGETHPYDIVEGPMADDPIWDCLLYTSHHSVPRVARTPVSFSAQFLILWCFLGRCGIIFSCWPADSLARCLQAPVSLRKPVLFAVALSPGDYYTYKKGRVDVYKRQSLKFDNQS